jgi:hypothetical protein
VDNGVPEPSDVPEQLKMGVEYTSSFTFYGSNDGDASANCSSTPDIACGLYSKVRTLSSMNPYLPRGCMQILTKCEI